MAPLSRLCFKQAVFGAGRAIRDEIQTSARQKRLRLPGTANRFPLPF
jgi:hypothetical protein